MDPGTAIAIVCKTPAVGRGKSRLWPMLGQERTAQLSACFIRDLAETMTVLPVSRLKRCYALFSPSGSEAELSLILPLNWHLVPRQAEDVGQVLEESLKALLHAGHTSVIFLNSDSPTLPSSLIDEAILALHAAGDRVVLGPTLDGGYYLIGLKAFHRDLFQDIAWSTPSVLSTTCVRAAQIGLPVHFLHKWYDVDDAADFQRLKAELHGQPPFPNATVKGASALHTRALIADWTEVEMASSQHSM